VSESNHSLIVLLFRSAVKAVSAYGESTTMHDFFSRIWHKSNDSWKWSL